ncbi:MAG: fumarylacetoacetate hydrolase family protein [Chloroflexi bacterium]|nr:fumarylacetoacetate hydrolase family protein [Chloroflexota bacterium]
MKLVQFYDVDQSVHVGVVQDEKVFDITDPAHDLTTTLDFVDEARRQRRSLDAVIEEKLAEASGGAHAYAELLEPDEPRLTMPLFPPQVWGCGVTYRRSAEFRDADMEGRMGIYDKVYQSDRPEIFYKGDTQHCAGPNEPIGIRVDSTFTAPEPELAYVLGFDNEIIGYTICDDVSAWDIERENPLYLPQSKIFLGCTALGPTMVTAGELTDPYNLEITARIRRNGTVIFEGSANTDQIRHPFETLTAYLVRNNPVPVGTVVSTGTGIIVTEEAALRAGDIVEIEIDEIGLLATPVRQLSADD